ncbi:MAG TPA: hypothetical protein VJN18_23360 [Polyangiaceae bacterium]|nr:hypothetical protein [Polyangiaceae bacterium]
MLSVRRVCALALLAAHVVACGSDDGAGQGKPNQTTGGSGNSAGSGSGSGSGPGPDPLSTPDIPAGDSQPAPAGETDLPLSAAPELGTVNFAANRSSVRLYLPGVSGAKDYRVFAVEDGVTVSSTDEREHVAGATIHCAGWRQRNQCSNDAILPLKYNAEFLDLPTCEIDNIDRRPHVPTSIMQTMDVNGIGPDTTLVVEAIDRLCPFPGLVGSRSVDVLIGSGDVGPPMVDVVVNDRTYSLKRFPDTFPLRTEAQVREDYGSMILNGQGPNLPTLDPSSPNFPESPHIRIGHPAPPNDPIVLARSVIKVSPLGTAELPEGFTDQDYFDDFDDTADQPVFVRDTDPTASMVGVPVNVYTTNKWVLYDVASEMSDFLVDRGQLHMVLADPSQNTMTAQALYPKRPVRLPTAADAYLHVTYEAQRNETSRRYENFTLCGSDEPGQTYNGEFPRAAPLPRPGFMNEGDTARTSILGWNCLLLVARGPGYWALDGGPDQIRSHSDSMLAVTVVGSHPPVKNAAEYNEVRVSPFTKAVGPTQEDPSPRRWLRQMDASGKLIGPWLDDQLHVWQRARFDVFVRRDRVVIYVEGKQRICQELTDQPLTMAEGALGLFHVLYHSSAEFTEMRRNAVSDNPQTGQHHLLHNTPFADHRSFDNVGFREDVALPDNFDPTNCFAQK